jgi:5-methyltetrahydropteroyltriglutamate--homocysteine methyltransferase
MKQNRTDHVGSLLRTEKLKSAKSEWQKNQISKEELRAIEDEEIKINTKKLEATGISFITDGEFRRDYFHLDFLKELAGVSVVETPNNQLNSKKADDGFAPPTLEVNCKLSHVKNIQVDDYVYLKSITNKTPKVSIPSPTMTHFRGGRKAIDIKSYPDLDIFFYDLAEAYKVEIRALYNAGLRYLQLDDTNLAYLCDEKMREAAKERGEDPNELPYTYANLINAVLQDKPDDLVTAIHLCRGNYKSTWFAQGSYEPVAEILFNNINVDRYLLEFDNERSGGFSPLKYVPQNKTIIIGIISSKIGTMEKIDELSRKIEQAGRYISLDQLGISPQCGFASTHHGNNISHDDQWRKLELVVNTARSVWGDS